MPPSSELEKGRVREPQVVLAADIDTEDIARRTGATIWKANVVAGEKSSPTEVRFPQEGTTLFVGEGGDIIIRFPHQHPRRRFQRREPQTVEHQLPVDAVIYDERGPNRGPGSVTFVYHRRNMHGATTRIDKVVLRPGQDTRLETIKMSGDGQLLPADAKAMLAINDSIRRL